MQLLLRVRPTGGTPRDLWVEVDPDTGVGALTTALAAEVCPGAAAGQPGLFREAGVRVDPHGTVGSCGLVSGDAVVVGAAPQRHYDGHHPEAAVPAGVTLDVIAGPEAGRSLVLTPGHHIVGRDGQASIAIADPTLSRRSFLIDVRAGGRCFVSPEPGATNDLLVDGRPVDLPVELGNESAVQAGATVVAVRRVAAGPADSTDRLGTIPFHRTPYRPSVITQRHFPPLGDIPARPDPRRFSLLGSLAPLAGGVALYAFSRRPEFLALTALTPVTMAGSWWEERRSGGRRFLRDAARLQAEVAARRAEVDDALQAERVERMRAAPDAIELARRAVLRSADLWPRGRSNGDFLDLRFGLGEVTSQVRAPVATEGDGDLRREAAAQLDGHQRLAAVPIVAPLTQLGTVSLLGPLAGAGDLVPQVAASLVLQAAVLHSPEDLIVAAALSPGHGLAEQLKWLPHTRSLNSPLATPHVVTTAGAARILCTQLVAVAQRRMEQDERAARHWPWLLVLLDQRLDLDSAVVARLLDLAPAAGICVLWLTASPARVPQQAAAVVTCVETSRGPSQLWFRDPALALVPLEIEPLPAEIASRAMRALAPVRDTSSATVTSAIPRLVPLFAALEIDDAVRASSEDAAVLTRSVVERWLADTGYSLAAPFGLSADGPMSIDLVADGPHALIGGTSGAGKSELLVALVAGLIARHPPNRLNLLFVDYKGGAASSVFRGVPHTVGYVTNLNAALANRALVSLRAELNRRMTLMEGRAKDLGEMLTGHPDLAPPSLVIVVDEFATLIKEVPEFVAGIVDVAQRGRSLGIHLILATQRPSGAVNDNILANTNARICLRMIDGGESSAIIGTPDAAAIPVPLRGRGFARLGPGQLTAFQAAYGGVPLAGGGTGRIRIRDFVPGATPSAAGVDGTGELGASGGPSQLEALLAAVDRAAEELAIPTPRAPWLDELPTLVPLEVVLRGFRSPAGRWSVPIGELDDPQRQRQDTVAVDLEEGGGLLVYGAAGSGKTTVLRTIAAAALAASSGNVVLFGLDFASRALRCLAGLDACAGVATGDDLEAVTRMLALLEQEVARRRELLSGTESLSAHLAGGGSVLPRLLLLVDGYVAMRDVLTGEGATAAMHGWLDRFHRLVTEGRQVGLHAVITADRPNGVAPVLTSAIARRLLLRQVDERGLMELGVPSVRARGLELGPGRGFLDAGLLVQVACLTPGPVSGVGAGSGSGPALPDGAAQAARLAAYGRGRGGVPPELRSVALQENELRPRSPGGGLAVLGVSDVTGTAATVDLTEGHLVLTGPAKSGRSTALAALLDSLREAGGGPEVYAVGPAASPLRLREPRCPCAFGDAAAIAALGAELAQLASSYPEVVRVLVIDDADRLLEDPAVAAALDPLARCDSIRVVAAVETSSVLAGYFQSSLMQVIRKVRRRLLLQPLDSGEIQSVLGVRFALRPGLEMPPGRGVLLAGRTPVVLQVGIADPVRAVVSGPAVPGSVVSGVPGKPQRRPGAG